MDYLWKKLNQVLSQYQGLKIIKFEIKTKKLFIHWNKLFLFKEYSGGNFLQSDYNHKFLSKTEIIFELMVKISWKLNKIW